MNPFLISAVVSTMLGLKRSCPECRRDQIVPMSKKRESVLCKFCKAANPPNR